MLASMAGDYAKEHALQEQSLAVLRQINDKDAVTVSLLSLGHTAQLHGNHASSRSLYQQSLEAAREAGNASLVAAALGSLGSVAYEEGDYAAARSLQEQSLAVLRESGDRTGVAYRLFSLGLAADAQGDYSAAISFYKESLAMHRESGDRLGISQCLAGLGDWAGIRKRQSKEERERAVSLLAAATTQFEVIGHTIRPRERAMYEAGLSRARAELGSEAFEKAWTEGRTMSVEQAVEYALQAAS
jgi:tetratricopeptide (TPR) repeat protein